MQEFSNAMTLPFRDLSLLDDAPQPSLLDKVKARHEELRKIVRDQQIAVHSSRAHVYR